MVKQRNLINLNCSYTIVVSEQFNKSYNAKNQMNKQILLDNSALTPFYSLKHYAIFSSSGKNVFPNFMYISLYSHKTNKRKPNL